jgi:hypothetical protein
MRHIPNGDDTQPSKNARFWNGGKKPRFSPPKTPFKTELVLAGL